MSVHNINKVANVPSNLISNSENNDLFRLLGYGCSTLSSGVVQLYLADSPDRGRWTKRCCGVVCFVKDNEKRSYFIRVFDIKKNQMVWEQELYTQFRYKTPKEFFHTFEADNCQAGLNFASEDEALTFKTAVEHKLTERHQRRIQRTQKRKNAPSVRSPQPACITPSPVSRAPPAAAPVNTIVEEKTKKRASKNKKGKSSVTKADIGAPSDFRHVSHVGWDPDKGFDMDNLDGDMKSLFQSVGIKPEDNVDKETIEFIYDFVDRNGGIEAVRKEMAGRPPAPLPQARPAAPARVSSRPQPPPPRSNAPPPPGRRQLPPPPSGTQKGRAPPPPIPAGSRALPPTPDQIQPDTRKPQPPPLMSEPSYPTSHPSSSPYQSPIPPIGGAPPPPPPGGGPPPPPPPPPPPMDYDESCEEERGGLLKQIHQGMALRKTASFKNTGSKPSDARGNLMKAIQGGANLKRVEQPAERPVEETGGLVGALALALVKRQKIIQGSAEEDEDDDDFDDDEWD